MKYLLNTYLAPLIYKGSCRILYANEGIKAVLSLLRDAEVFFIAIRC